MRLCLVRKFHDRLILMDDFIFHLKSYKYCDPVRFG